MVTPEKSVQIISGVAVAAETYSGLSTEEKPRNVGNGSWFVSIDKVGKKDADGNPENFLSCYDAENDKWYPDEDEEGS